MSDIKLVRDKSFYQGSDFIINFEHVSAMTITTETDGIGQKLHYLRVFASNGFLLQRSIEHGGQALYDAWLAWLNYHCFQSRIATQE